MSSGQRTSSGLLVLLCLGAIASLSCMFYAGHRNPSVILMTIFTGWVLLPFAVALRAATLSKTWKTTTRNAFNRAVPIIVLAKVAAYAYFVLGPPRAKIAAIFLIAPPASILAAATLVWLAARLASSPTPEK